MPVVKLGGKPLNLRFSFLSFERMDQHYGVNALRPSTFNNFSPTVGATLVWGGQLHADKPLSRDEILKLMPTDTEKYFEIMEQVSAALKVALGVPTIDDKKPQ